MSESEDKENEPERLCSVTQEDLARMGMDEEGIFNFLHDAIGTDDLSTEVLREFSNSDHFAELLDVVTNSLTTEVRSRRASAEVIEVVPMPNSEARNQHQSHIILEKGNEPLEGDEIEDEGANKESCSSRSVAKACRTNSIDDSKPLRTKQTDELRDLGEGVPESPEIPPSVVELELEEPSDRKSSAKSNADDNKLGDNSKPNEENLASDETNKTEIQPQVSPEAEIASKKKTFTPFFAQDFLKYQYQFNLKHCSVILCDIISMSRDYNIFESNNYEQLTNLKSVNLTREILKDALRLEKNMRKSFSEKLDKSLDPNIVFQELNKRESLKENFVKSGKEKEDNTKGDKSSEGKTKLRNKESKSESDSSSSSDIQFISKKSQSNSKKKDEDNKAAGEHSKSKAEYSAGGTRILPFERKKIPEENRPRKFDKFERMLKEKSKGVKKDNKPTVKHEPSVPEKNFTSSSFRIPKKKDGQILEKKSSVLTPLASQDIPSENLKFERCRINKSNDDRRSKTDVYRNKDGGREAYLNGPIKIEIELADEPDSFADDDDGATSQTPLSEVKVGHLVLSVATFLRENSDVELPLVEDTATASELLVIKIAWWFQKKDKDPPSEEVFIPELCDTVLPCCDEDNNSDISFLGHVSNPGDETEECQINEVSSSSNRIDAESDKLQDPNKLDEFCGCALLQAKYRTAAGDNFQNVFDLRNGASYDKENFQAKCNLCNELIVGRANLAIHVRKQDHRENLLNTSLKMAKSDGKSEVKVKLSDAKNDKKDKDKEKEKDSKIKEKEREKDKSVKNDADRNGKTDNDKTTGKSKSSKPEMERTKTSTGLSIKVPIMPGANRKRSRSRTRSPRRKESKSPRPKSRSPHRRSPIQYIVRSPLRHSPPRHRHKRRSRSPRKRSRSPRHLPLNNRRSRSPNRHQRSSSFERERVEEFLARTNRGRRSRSPSSSSKRQRRSRSRSPKPVVKVDNKEFHEKLALTVDGKWTSDMENRWNLMEADTNIFLKQFQDRQKQLHEKPEDHPSYADEWTAFWEKRYQEVEKAGKDPDAYDYVAEWKEFWLKRVVHLLQLEGDFKLKEIKKKYGMDYESLRKLRFTPTEETNLKVEVDSFLPAASRVIVPSNVLNFPPPLSVSDRGSDDQLSRAMSISDDGHSESKHKATGKRNSPKKPNVTVDDIKSTWESLTGQKIGSAKSDAGSSSVASYDFDGFDLVQVLRLMCQIDHTLGIYAQQVQDFFRMAEELEISKRNKSYSLLNKKDFVELLFKCRDKFMNVIRANVVARDVLKSINLTVYALNAILDSPQCQQFKPSLDAALSMEIDVPTVNSSIEVKPNPIVHENAESNAVPPPKISPAVNQSVTEHVEYATISQVVSHLSLPQKTEIAGLIAKALILDGRENINDAALMAHLMLVFTPMLGDRKEVGFSDESNFPSTQQEFTENRMEGMRDHTRRFPSNNVVQKIEDQSNPVIATRPFKSAIPSLPVLATRAASPPPRVPNPIQNAPNPFLPSGNNSRVSSQYHPYGGTRGFGRGRPTSPVNSGRRSPFSRRGYAGNPAPDSQDQDTDEGDSAYIYDRESEASNINLNLTEAVSILSNQLLTNKESVGLYSPPTSVSISSDDDFSYDGIPKSVKLNPGIFNLIIKERSSIAQPSSSRSTSCSVPLKGNHSIDEEKLRERKRPINRKREKQDRRSPKRTLSAERKYSSRDNRRDRRGRERSRRSSIDENNHREKRNRYRSSRCSKSSSRSSIVRLPLQGPSQGVNSRHKPTTSTSKRSYKEKSPPGSAAYNCPEGLDQVDIPNGAILQKHHPKQRSKPSRGVSAIFWETESISGTEGNDLAHLAVTEEAFTDDKIKARHYRKQKLELEPGEIITSTTDFSSGAESAVASCAPRMKKYKHFREKRRDLQSPAADQEICFTGTAGSRDSFEDFDECMTKENVIPVVDLDTSFEEREQTSRKIQLNLPEGTTVGNSSPQNDSAESLTDFEFSDISNNADKNNACDLVASTTVVQTVSCESRQVCKESPPQKERAVTEEKLPEKSQPNFEVLSDGELSNITADHEMSESKTDPKDLPSKADTNVGIEDDLLSKVSTISSNVLELNEPHSPNSETEKCDETQEKNITFSDSCNEKLPVSENSPISSQSVQEDAGVVTSTNVDSMEENVDEPPEYAISINQSIFDTCSEDENIEDNNPATKDESIKLLESTEIEKTINQVEQKDDQSVNSFTHTANELGTQFATPYRNDTDQEKAAEEMLISTSNITDEIIAKVSEEVYSQQQHDDSGCNSDSDSENSIFVTHNETKLLNENNSNGLGIVQLDDVTTSVEVTEEFLQ